VQVQNELETFRKHDVNIVAIGQGTGEEATRFARQWGITFPVLGDPNRQSYRAFGLAISNWRALLFQPLVTNPRLTLSRLFSADISGAKLKAARPLQLGGVAIVDGSGMLRFLHRAETAEDNPSNGSIIRATESCGS
jgi:hypothetical protein